MRIDELIGLPFKRNVYGPSLWTDTVQEIEVHWKIVFSSDLTSRHSIPEIYIRGTKNISYSLSEIIFNFKELTKEQQERIKAFIEIRREKEVKWQNMMKSKKE